MSYASDRSLLKQSVRKQTLTRSVFCCCEDHFSFFRQLYVTFGGKIITIYLKFVNVMNCFIASVCILDV